MRYTFEQATKLLREKDNHLVDTAVQTIRRDVKLHGPRLVQAEITSLTPRAPVDRGTYRRSFKFEDIPGGAAAYNFSPHGPIVEDGRRAGARMPPLDVILAWVKRKKIGAEIKGPVQAFSGPRQRGGKNRSDRVRAVEAQQHWIALQIARKIKARGLPAHHILKLASDKLELLIGEDLAKVLNEGAESPHDPHA